MKKGQLIVDYQHAPELSEIGTDDNERRAVKQSLDKITTEEKDQQVSCTSNNLL